tara:strand:+ start:433 stop:603 length:171 start_codon:yes stop_codon:yes gene_type:complete
MAKKKKKTKLKMPKVKIPKVTYVTKAKNFGNTVGGEVKAMASKAMSGIKHLNPFKK